MGLKHNVDQEMITFLIEALQLNTEDKTFDTATIPAKYCSAFEDQSVI